MFNPYELRVCDGTGDCSVHLEVYGEVDTVVAPQLLDSVLCAATVLQPPQHRHRPGRLHLHGLLRAGRTDRRPPPAGRRPVPPRHHQRPTDDRQDHGAGRSRRRARHPPALDVALSPEPQEAIADARPRAVPARRASGPRRRRRPARPPSPRRRWGRACRPPPRHGRPTGGGGRWWCRGPSGVPTPR